MVEDDTAVIPVLDRLVMVMVVSRAKGEEPVEEVDV